MALFNAFEDEYCFLPFHLYDGLSSKLIATVLRPGKPPTDREILNTLKRIVKRLRKAFSKHGSSFGATPTGGHGLAGGSLH